MYIYVTQGLNFAERGVLGRQARFRGRLNESADCLIGYIWRGRGFINWIFFLNINTSMRKWETKH